MALIELNDSMFDDGYVSLTPQMWFKQNGGNTTGSIVIDEDTIKKIIVDNVKEINDKLVVGGEEVGTDNYVRSGELNEEGTLTLNVGEDGKDVEIDLTELKSKPMGIDDIKSAAGL